MTEVIVHHLVATLPSGDMAPNSGDNSKREEDRQWALITHLERKRRTTSCSSFSRHTAVSDVALCCAHLFAGADDMATLCLPCWDVPCSVMGSGRLFYIVVRVDASRRVDYM